jgi:hypothetical protein
MLKYGSDKPDLRNPLLISDVGEHFRGSGFGLFAKMVEAAGSCAPSRRPNTADKSRKFFDDMNEWARGEGYAGLGYVTRKGGEFGGPDRQEPWRPAWPRSPTRWAWARTTASSSPPARRPRPPSWPARPHPRRRAARPDREGRVPLLLDRRFPDVRI